jgi:hypothetical protein
MSKLELVESIYNNTSVPSLGVANEVVSHLLELGVLEVVDL